MLNQATAEAYANREEDYHIFTLKDASKSPLMRQYFQLRKQVFIDGLGWDLNETDLGEMDQYDRTGAFYLISEKHGEVVGGMRLMPTTTAFLGRDGQRYSYMIRDAREGRLQNMPRDLITQDAPVDPKIWELTRVITSKEPYHLKKMTAQACEFLKTKLATHFVIHTRPAAGRLGKIWGYDVERMGPAVGIGGIDFQVHRLGVM